MRSFSWQRLWFSSFAGMLFSGLIIAAPVSAAQEVAREELVAVVELGPGDVTWAPTFRQKYEYLRLTVITPAGTTWFGRFPAGEKPVFSLKGNSALEPEVLDNGRDEMSKPDLRFTDGIYMAELRVIPSETGQTQAVSFCVEGGRILLPEEESEPSQEEKQ